MHVLLFIILKENIKEKREREIYDHNKKSYIPNNKM